jgi:hypothetical protein
VAGQIQTLLKPMTKISAPFLQLNEQLSMLSELVRQLDHDHYCMGIPAFSGSSIGDHTRHIIEILGCAVDGYDSGIIDYHNRARDQELAKNMAKALKKLEHVQKSSVKEDKPVSVRSYESREELASTYFREISYNVEHAIHHMALIKVALHLLSIQLESKAFGMAYSTLANNESTIRLTS